MSRIHSKDTKPEKIVPKYLLSRGLRYRNNDNRLQERLDMVFPKYHTFVFANGCFWHKYIGYNWFVPPKTNTAFG